MDKKKVNIASYSTVSYLQLNYIELMKIITKFEIFAFASINKGKVLF